MKVRLTEVYPNRFGGGTFLALPQRRKDWRIISVTWLYSNSAIVANRTPMMVITDGANGTILQLVGTTTVASEVGRITFCEGVQVQANVAAQTQVSPIPWDLWIRPQWGVNLGMNTSDAGDVLSGIIVQSESVEEPAKKAAASRPSPQEAPG